MDQSGAEAAAAAAARSGIPETRAGDGVGNLENGFNIINALEAIEDDRIVEELPPIDHLGNGLDQAHDDQSVGFDILEMNAQATVGNASQDSNSPTQVDPQSPQNISSSAASGASSTNIQSDNIPRASDLLIAVSVGAEPTRKKVMEQAVAAMNDLTRLALAEGEPLWQRRGDMEVLNGLQYLRDFTSIDSMLLDEVMRFVKFSEQNGSASFELPSSSTGPAFEFNPLHIECSRAIGFVDMAPVTIIELLMDLKQWSEVFSNIVSSAAVLGVISAADGTFNGMLQVMTAEFHLHTPLVPPRKCYFARYCKQLDSATWGVVDVSLENLFPYPGIQFLKRPSGCLIQQTPNQFSKITWVEHVESDNNLVHPIFQKLVNSAFVFGAKRWIAWIMQHCQWQSTLMAPNVPTIDGENGRISLLKLSERMRKNFFRDISASTENTWIKMTGTGAEDVRVRTGESIPVPGRSPSTTIIFTTSIWLPTPPRKVFDFLRDEHSRNKWDLLSDGRFVREIAYVINGQSPENRISVLQVDGFQNKIEILYLQESFWDGAGCSYVIYAPVDIIAMSMILNGGNPDYLPILPSGFAVLPDKPATLAGEETGSILTLAFHIVDCNSAENHIPPESAQTIDRVISSTVACIKAAVAPDIQQCNCP
ncbi:hypothetical protein SLE2022_395740 [Rubroshorea leprosula]